MAPGSNATSSEAAAALSATLARVGLAETDLGAVSATIARRTAPAEAAGVALPRVSVRPSVGATEAAPSDLVALRELGRGGMGVVHLAEQRSLGREVAVKTARTSDTHVVRALVREARVMGALEHPSLVPVHALGLDATGAPVLVMKRVEGVSWRELLRDEGHAAWAPLLAGHGDRLRAHVDILSQLARALAFAHEHGVVHRDLKPENVMVGRFGEVVLLDWGVALRLSERETEPEGIVGTPGYLAPEMARGDPKLVDARTDVYLLGATLYEVLTGHMPHEAPTAIAALTSALIGDVPALPEGAPAELATLVRGAMAREPADRLASAEAFREGLARYLVSREADVLAADARAALARADASMRVEGAASAAAFRALIEARFGLTAALRMRPHDEALREELDASVVKLVERELALRSPDAARALVGDLAHAPPELVAKVDALDAEVRREREAAEAAAVARKEADSSSMVRPLTFTIVIWTGLAVPLALWFMRQAAHGEQGFPVREALAYDFGGAGIFLGLLFVLRKRFFATAGSRRMTLAYTIWIVGIIAQDPVTFAFGHGTNEASAHSMTAGAALAALLSATILRELWPVVAAHVAAVVGILTFPQFSPVFVFAALLLDFVVFTRAWRLHAARSSA